MTQRNIFEQLKTLIAGSRFEGQVYAAGGCVRDMVLGRESKDIDVVVTLPNGGIEFAQWVAEQGGNTPVIFPRFGTAKFVWRGIDLEAVMPRAEVYDGETRNPDVAFASLEEDAKRRDFTVNALYWDISREQLLDYVGGLVDIEDRVIRTAIDPDVIFTDDPLRMLRAIRFARRFGWALETTLFNAIHKHADQIQRISQERITAELNEIITSHLPTIGFNYLRATGLLSYIMPEVSAMIDVGQNKYHDVDVFQHSMRVMEFSPPTLVARLAALFHDVGKPDTRIAMEGEVHFSKHKEVGAVITEQVLRRMKYPNAIVDVVVQLVREHMRLENSGEFGDNVTDKALRRFRADLGDNADLLLDLMHADNQAHAPKYCLPYQIPALRPRFEQLAMPTPKVVLPINGHDIMQEFGLGPGKQVGELLAMIKEEYFADPSFTREQALDLIRVTLEP